MKIFNKTLTFLLLVFLVNISAQDINDARFQNIVKQLKLQPSKIHTDLCVEKKMPNWEDSYIVVVPILLGPLENDGFSVKNTILITDSKGVIKNKYTDPTEFGSDAIMLTSFTIDTGLYNLNSNIRAFGISTNYTGSSKPNPYSASYISLYYPEQKTLNKILDQYQIYRFGGEWNMSCNGEFDENKSVIIVEKTKTNGFADLKIKTESIRILNKEINGDCNEDKTSKFSYKTLRFNKSVFK